MKHRTLFLLLRLLSLIIISHSRKVLKRVKRSSSLRRSSQNATIVKGLAGSPPLERNDETEEEGSFLQVDHAIYFGSRKNVAQLKVCCDSVIREGISTMVQKVTQDLEQVSEARSLYFFLKQTGGKFNYRIESPYHF